MTTPEFRADIFSRLNELAFDGPGFWGVLLKGSECPPEFSGLPMRKVLSERSWLVRSATISTLIRVVDDLTELHRQGETPFSKIQFGRAVALDEEGNDVVGFSYDYFQDSGTPQAGYIFCGGRDFIEGYLGALEQCHSPEGLNRLLAEKVADGHELEKWLGRRDWGR